MTSQEERDIVSRLRKQERREYSEQTASWRSYPDSLCLEAADTIERLREALKPFAEAVDKVDGLAKVADDRPLVFINWQMWKQWEYLLVGHFRAARQALDPRP